MNTPFANIQLQENSFGELAKCGETITRDGYTATQATIKTKYNGWHLGACLSFGGLHFRKLSFELLFCSSELILEHCHDKYTTWHTMWPWYSFPVMRVLLSLGVWSRFAQYHTKTTSISITVSCRVFYNDTNWERCGIALTPTNGEFKVWLQKYTTNVTDWHL